jgi:short-subunit dehydrogenase
MQDPKSIAITGGSSGIGAALARAYAAPGVSLALAGRDMPRLEAVVAACRAAGAVVTGTRVEVTDRDAVARWIAAADRAAPLDLVIANAGTSAGTASGGESDHQTRAIFAVNLEGVMNTVLPAVAALRGRRRGQVAIMSSLAGFRGFPGAPAYCASKAAVRIWGESLRGHLAPQGIGVTVICPGFVKSPMTAVNQFPMPLLVDSDAAARRIKRGLARNRARISFPRPLAAAIWLLGALPPAWTDPLLAKLPEKR